MPQVTINEIDQSRYLSVANRAPLIALTPVVSSFGPIDDAVLIETETQYNNIFGPQLPTPVIGDISRNYAITLINSGATLLAKRIEPVVLMTTGDAETSSTVVDTSYNVNTLTAGTTYTVPSLATVTVGAKHFGTRGNDIAYKFSKVVLSSGALDEGSTQVIYRINTYLVNSHSNVTQSEEGLWIGTFDSDLLDYVGVDSFTISTNPTDDNYIGNTTYLNSQLENINVGIAFAEGVAPNVDNYKTLLDALCALTTDVTAILLVGGNDYFVKVPRQIIGEAYTSGTALAHKPVVPTTFTATVTDGDDTYKITEGTATAGIVTLVCDELTGFSGTLNYETGAITLTGLPQDSTVAMNYNYTDDANNTDIKQQFINAISFDYNSSTNYPKTHNKFWEAFSDHYVYDFDVIVSSGFTGLDNVLEVSSNQKASNLHVNMLRLAIVRGDAVALIDTPQHWTYTDVYTYTKNVGGYQSMYSYGAVHAPWCKMRDLSTGNYAMMPASLAFLGAVASGLVSNGESSLWYAPAGVARASCNNVVGAQYEIGGTILNYWQNDNVARVNPIMRILSYGYCVYGNATLMQNMKGYTKSSLQSLGTRFLCNAIKKAIFSLCVRLTFEPNDYNLWSTFRTELGDTLRQYQLNGVISQYEIIMDDSTVTNEDKQNLTVPGKVNIVPTLPAEYFDIDFTISAQGVTFSEQVLEEEE